MIFDQAPVQWLRGREEMTAAIMEIRRREKLYLTLKEYITFVYAANTGKTAVKWISLTK